MRLTNKQIKSAMTDPRSGTYRNQRAETEVIVAYIDGVPHVIGWVSCETLRIAPQHMIAEFEREVWDTFRKGQLWATLIQPATQEAQP